MKKLITTLGFLVAATIAVSQVPAIHVETKGSGKPVIFLPGFTTPGSVWNETIEKLKGQTESHMVSYAGFNGHAPIEMPWYETIKAALLKYISDKDLSSIQIIGHSMGGNLAVDIAASIPDKVESIVLVDAIPCMRELMMPGVPAESLQYDSPYNNQTLALNEEAFRQNAAMMAQHMTNNSEKVNAIITWSIEADRKTYVYGFTDLLKLDLRPALKNVKARTLILGAPFPEKAIVLANFEKQYENLTAKTIEIAPDSKHFIMFDQPEWFYEKLNNFLFQ